MKIRDSITEMKEKWKKKRKETLKRKKEKIEKKKGWKKRNMYLIERKESQKQLTEGGVN